MCRYLLNDSIAAHLEAFRDRKIEEEITFLFPNPVFRVAGDVLWIAEIATAEGKTICSAEGFDEIGIELFDAFYGPVSLFGVLLGRCSAFAATIQANGDRASYQVAAGRLTGCNGSHVPGHRP